MKHETPATMLLDARIQLMDIEMGLACSGGKNTQALLELVSLALGNVKRVHALLTNSGPEGKPLV